MYIKSIKVMFYYGDTRYFFANDRTVALNCGDKMGASDWTNGFIKYFTYNSCTSIKNARIASSLLLLWSNRKIFPPCEIYADTAKLLKRSITLRKLQRNIVWLFRIYISLLARWQKLTSHYWSTYCYLPYPMKKIE